MYVCMHAYKFADSKQIDHKCLFAKQCLPITFVPSRQRNKEVHDLAQERLISVLRLDLLHVLDSAIVVPLRAAEVIIRNSVNHLHHIQLQEIIIVRETRFGSPPC